MSIVRMGELVTVSRASFYRHGEEKAPTEAAMALRDVIQRIAVAPASRDTAAWPCWCSGKAME